MSDSFPIRCVYTTAIGRSPTFLTPVRHPSRTWDKGKSRAKTAAEDRATRGRDPSADCGANTEGRAALRRPTFNLESPSGLASKRQIHQGDALSHGETDNATDALVASQTTANHNRHTFRFTLNQYIIKSVSGGSSAFRLSRIPRASSGKLFITSA